jgi:hypothetical protein
MSTSPQSVKNASPSSEASKVLTAKRPIITSVIPLEIVIIDVEVREGFLSDDLETICAVATKSGSAVLLATAGQPLKAREASFQLWRKSLLRGLHCEGLNEFLSKNTAPELIASFRDGTVDLLVLDAAIHNECEIEGCKASELRAAQKETVRAAFWSHCEGVTRPYHPRYLVVRGDGELRLMKNLTAVKKWGSIGNSGYSTVPLKGEEFRSFYPTI